MNTLTKFHWITLLFLLGILSTVSFDVNITEVTILHFNDVYNIEPIAEEPVGGAARFCSLLCSYKPLDPLVLFSGDVFSPSVLSSFVKGAHMVPVLNECGVHSAVFGNHDFDYGISILKQRVRECQFPWLLSNVLDKRSNGTIANSQRIHIIQRGEKRFGLIGLIEEKWLDTQFLIDTEQIIYLDFVNVCKDLTVMLLKQGCDFIIALTHMRLANDIILAEGCPGIDLILGGHDHDYEINKVKEKYIIKSGTDFKQLSKVTLQFMGESVKDIKIQNIQVTSQIEEQSSIKNLMTVYQGQTIISALENAVSQYPQSDGRFLQVAGIKFAFDPYRSAGHRILLQTAIVGQKLLNQSRIYQLATRVYMHRGFDKYSMLKGAKEVADDNGNCMTLRMIIDDYFQTVHNTTKSSWFKLLSHHSNLLLSHI